MERESETKQTERQAYGDGVVTTASVIVLQKL